MIATATKFSKEVLKDFPYQPTLKQELLLDKLACFIFDNNDNALFILKGYAGTGKTTIISTVVNNLEKANRKGVLLAPTGRAAKVISGYSKKKAFTIHKKIYFAKKQGNSGMSFVKQPNKHVNTIFIVDEASMISDAQQNSKLFENGSLLDDLISYVYSGKNCKLVFIGDTAQLPPVKLTISPALESDKLSFDFNKDVIEIELDEVVRQEQNSGILANATDLRMLIQYNTTDFQFNINYPDIIRLEDSYDIQDAITTAYDGDTGVEDTAFIVRSNKRANQYNDQIRTKIRGQENEISTGDYVMIVKNNYFWLKESSSAGFIANGDICEVMRINSIKELYGFKFAEVEVRMIDYPDMPAFETVLLLDTLSSESPSLTYEQSNKLYEAVKEDFAGETKYKQFMEVKKNKYFNALQVKFSYAMTCHKSQGGQWDTVFIEQPYLPDGQSVEYLRWLYTAITRAQNKLYLIGFQDDYFLD
ncbi:AAA family ATPase [Tenacibaculum pacificus]|uniref:ATP-dependent DNA helicase n=1 Tax=Tenacibaculum pacificus TaxID=3018314 RepID=UPI0022F3965B|nr:AAA family ATPase [Tenacibaculum pacificus]WBX74691.1 AAA family ATPase [Tenacibaculum pacificus]